MTKLTTECLEKFVNDIKTDGMCDITDSQVESALIRLLAYEQADKTTDLKTLVISEIVDFYSGFESPYEPETVDEAQRQLIGRIEKVFGLAAPVLPKQPELMSIGELLQRLEEQTGEKWVEESAQPVIPEGLIKAINRLLDNDGSRGRFSAVQSYDAREDLERLLASTAQPVSEPYKSAANDIIAERQRQISAEGWTPERNDSYSCGELAGAAACYARYTNARGWVFPTNPTDYQSAGEPFDWPWDAEWWKPTNPRRDLVKAGALILAEIERLDRAMLAAAPEQQLS